MTVIRIELDNFAVFCHDGKHCFAETLQRSWTLSGARFKAKERVGPTAKAMGRTTPTEVAVPWYKQFQASDQVGCPLANCCRTELC
jgi:hypothetical protein